jgi:hypothetical protein
MGGGLNAKNTRQSPFVFLPEITAFFYLTPPIKQISANIRMMELFSKDFFNIFWIYYKPKRRDSLDHGNLAQNDRRFVRKSSISYLYSPTPSPQTHFATCTIFHTKIWSTLPKTY